MDWGVAMGIDMRAAALLGMVSAFALAIWTTACDSGDAASNRAAGGSTGSGGTAGAGGDDGGDAPATDDGASLPKVEEFTIPTSAGCDAATPYPHDPAVDENTGLVYYADTDNNCVGQFNPATLSFTAWPAPTPASAPHGVTVLPDGIVFYTAQAAQLMGRLDPAAGKITNEYPAMTDPHTPLFHMGAVWFTSSAGNRYGQIDPTSGVVTLYGVPTAAASPYGIDHAPNGRIWIALFGTNELGEVDPSRPDAIVEHVLPDAASRPRRLAVDPSGRVWYSDYNRDRLGMFDPSTNQFREWQPPVSGGLPYGIAIGPDGRVWYNKDAASVMVAFDPLTEKAETLTIPTPGSTVRNVAVDKPRRRIWLALSGTGRLGLIQL
jgi:virginiamycin B lyase